MSASELLQGQTKESDSGTAIYVYGIVPGDVEPNEDAQGIGDPPAKVDVVRDGEIAALVSRVSTDHPLGKPDDLRAHARLLDGTAAVAPVLPLRFGAVMTDAESVATELLHDHHDEFAHALKVLEGHAEYIIKGRYDDKKFLSKLLEEDAQARALRDDIRDKPEDASRDSRMALGELIANTIESTRQVDTLVVVDELDDVAVQVHVREPTHEWDAVHVAVLGRLDRQAEVEAVLDRLRGKSGGLVDLRLLGPVAAYDFVVTTKPAG